MLNHISPSREGALESRQKGSGLIEVLVSLVILSVGILGLMGLQAKATQFNQGALFQVRATILAEDYFDRMRSNSFSRAFYTIGFSDSAVSYVDCEDPAADCTSEELAAYDVGTWKEEVESVLPGAKVRVTNIAPTSEYIIDIEYNDGRIEASSKAGSQGLKLVSFRTMI